MDKISFFNHEVEGANIAYRWMKDMGFSQEESVKVQKLVRHHQWRFYEDTNRVTIRKWLEEIGYQGYVDLMLIRLADREGNLRNKDKPALTAEHISFVNTVLEMIDSGEVFFPENLAVQEKDLYKMGVRHEQHHEAISNMLGIVRANPSRNTKAYLCQFIQRNYNKGKQ